MTPEAATQIVRRALNGNDCRDIVAELIDASFVNKSADFLRDVAIAKLRDVDINLDWCKERFDDAGLNKINESRQRCDRLDDLVKPLIDDDIDVGLSLTFRSVTVRLSLNEIVLVVNALAIMRAAIRGGAWSAAGKQVEKPLMESLCRIFGVNPSHFTRTIANDGSLREVDFYLLPPDGTRARCEVKLMGQGNPEGADVARARNSNVFVASVLSDKNKTQLDSWGVHWTELQTEQGFLRFSRTLDAFGVPHSELPRRSDYSDDIDRAVRATFAP